MLIFHRAFHKKFFFLLFVFYPFQNLYALKYKEQGIVVAAHPLATEAGRIILEKGGSAVDAAVTVQAVLGLVEPQSSGMGGGGFLLHYSNINNQVTSFDGREKAPLKIKPEVFEQYRGSRAGFFKAVTSSLSIGVPGIPAMLGKAHEKYGQLDWKSLFNYPINLAKTGFNITPRFYTLVKRDIFLTRNKKSLDYYYSRELGAKKKFIAKPVGTLIRNSNYANTLTKIAFSGASEFYTGSIPQLIINDLLKINKNTLLTKKDFQVYKSKQRKPVCGFYRKYKICSMGPPSSGGIAILQILGILENFDSSLLKNNIKKIHLLTEATRLALADRAKYLGDPDFVEVPIKKLINKKYLASRSKLIKLKSKALKIYPGKLNLGYELGLNDEILANSTTHFVIIDKFGNAVSMTSSVESAFGSRIMSEGMMMNNQLTDFSFKYLDDLGFPISNSVAPGKRPLSSMTPTIIFDPNGNLYALVGSPGGKSIISYVAQTIVGLIDLNFSMQKSINEPRFLVQGKNTILEKNSELINYSNNLKQLGHTIKIKKQFSGLHGIKLKKNTTGFNLEGGADPRREGTIEFTSF